MQGEFESKQLLSGRAAHAHPNLEADWNFLRAHLDHPAHLWRARLGFGLADWLSRRLRPAPMPPPLSILARIQLGPRQAVALVEAEGKHLLVGSSADGPLSFFPLPSGQRDATVRTADPDAEPAPVPVPRSARALAGPDAPASTKDSAWFPPPAIRGSRRGNRTGISGRVSW